MSSAAIGLVTFGCTFGAAVVGLFLGGVLPKHHLCSDTKDAVKMGAGFIATLAALVLGLLITSAKGSFDVMSDAIVQGGAKVILLDRTLARYGEDETRAIRAELKRTLISGMAVVWTPGMDRRLVQSHAGNPVGMEGIQDALRRLMPENDVQRALQTQAIGLTDELLRMRWLTAEQAQIPMPATFVNVLLFWLAVFFLFSGLLASRNATVLAVLFVCAVSISGAIFLIRELNGPFDGLIQVSKAPFINAINLLNDPVN